MLNFSGVIETILKFKFVNNLETSFLIKSGLYCEENLCCKNLFVKILRSFSLIDLFLSTSNILIFSIIVALPLIITSGNDSVSIKNLLPAQ